MVAEWVDDFIGRTRCAVFVRPADGLLLVRPERTMSLNASAVRILGALYAPGAGPAETVLRQIGPELGAPHDLLVRDTEALVRALAAILAEDFRPREALRFAPFHRGSIEYPTIAEIALTYRCQNRCTFCYAASPSRGDEGPVMTTGEVVRVMERIFHEGHVPSLSFTGGEATLRPDLCELVRRGKALGFRMNLITNGLRAADPAFARRLVEAGMDSAQISLEAADPALHDRIVGRQGAHARTVAAVRNFKALGIHVHTNSTLCGDNLDHGPQIVKFAARDLGLQTLSMNMLIRTGNALARADVTYTQIAERLPLLHETAKENGVRFVWYSPIPYCIFNPVLAELGGKSCACVDGILSVGPRGEVLPCSSFEDGIGSLVDEPYDRIQKRAAARYWREKKFVPPVCKGCPDVDVCGGACPLYWDHAGSFAELPRAGAGDPEARRSWERERRRGESWGVPCPVEER
ncbi:MAG: radical SAM protein [Deltaproteobacteria bacterium]|nr:radical SAM protein [Deltaproteobacteria bacterium]